MKQETSEKLEPFSIKMTAKRKPPTVNHSYHGQGKKYPVS